ncbi:Enhancer of polycomb-like protein 1 [Lambiella insularis]|nr:Enhancer of polycomb-like protein 1 [Lambiella insularis]
MTRTVGGRAVGFRQRKLNTRSQLPILHEADFETEGGLENAVPKVETGVEKAEETEHHLQAAISASQAAAVGGKVAQIYIPTPDTIHSSIQYDRLYLPVFSQPATYIRFSSTVEDCCGTPYNLTEEDDVCLKFINEKRNASTQCSEDQFEEVMNFFEETAKSKQPFAALDNPPVVSWEAMESAFDENLDDHLRSIAVDIYEHWKSRRLSTGNQPLAPGLKFGTGTDTDDGDPYVCFRRREVRQVRKTRGRDAQSVEKLKKLRKELEDARQLLALVRQREITKREQMSIDRQLFEQRSNLRQVKKHLPDQYREGDDELLVNQKPQKKKPLEIATSQRTPAGQLRSTPRSDGRSLDADMVLLQDILGEKENELHREIEIKISQHKRWNENYVDQTRAPLTPPLEESLRSSFRTALTEYLPTPPASVSSELSGDALADAGSPARKMDQAVTVRYASPTYNLPFRSQPSFRRRIGRGGRLFIDRRGMNLQSKEGIDPAILDRFKYDRDDDDDDEVAPYLTDPYDIDSMRYRAAIAGSSPSQPQNQSQSARRPQLEASASNSQRFAAIPSSSSPPKNAPAD